MIVDKIENIAYYKGLGENFVKAIGYIEKTDLNCLPLGKTIPDKGFYLVVSESDFSSTKSRWELHQKYADIQIVLEGSEVISYYSRSGIHEEITFQEDKDIAFLSGSYNSVDVSLSVGDFMLLLPQDVHKPGQKPSSSDRVKKVVVKVLL